MIIDNIKNIGLYYSLNKNFKTAFDYITNTEINNMECGKYEIDGENVFIIIQEHETKLNADWESHRKYSDIQYIIEGKEKIYFATIDTLNLKTEYDSDKDVTFYTGNGHGFILEQGYFAIFFPHDAHKPSMTIEKPEIVKKAVIKVKV